MALSPAPAFVGKITVSSSNNKLYWHEDDGSTYDLSATIADGDYWPDALCTAIVSAMDTASSGSGASNTYAASFDVSTGKYTISRDSGTATFYLKFSTSETANILHGGDDDSGGNSLSTGQWGQNAIGWTIESGYPSLGTSFTSTRESQHYWLAPYPPQADDDGLSYDSTHTQVTSISGAVTTYDFAGWSDSASEHPVYGGLFRSRTISIEFVTTDQKQAWIAQFWGPYGKAGSTFRYYADNTDDTTYQLFVLMGDSLASHGFGERISGYQWWRGSISMHRVAS